VASSHEIGDRPKMQRGEPIVAGIEKTQPVKLVVNGKERVFDIDNPELPSWIDKEALASGGFPYDKKLDGDDYDAALKKLQIELVKVQFWQQATGKRVMAIFEGRDAAGKGGAIYATRSYMNPRNGGNGIISVTSRIFQPPANSSCSTAPGTIGAASSRSWASARPSRTSGFSNKRHGSRGLSPTTVFTFSNSGWISAARCS
jgi:hypothetical protein